MKDKSFTRRFMRCMKSPDFGKGMVIIMIIQHNIPAMYTSRELGVTTGKLAKSAEKLSSGYRINRAGDDTAGLSISEKMRAQIRGLTQASTNAQDGISLLQTAEGALGEIQNVVQRMRELSVQSANDTNCSEDRTAIQKEIDQLTSEIDRIAEDTEFNTIKLLNGNLASQESVGGSIVSPMVRAINNTSEQSESNLQTAMDSVGENEIGIFYEVSSDYETTQTPSGASTIGSYDPDFVDQLTKEIVPNAVKSLAERYNALSYLKGSSIGMGLKLYSESSTKLASVGASAGGTLSNINITYTLSVNMNSVEWDAATNTITNREELEATIAHEMTHAFMDEALTCGMMGITNTGDSVSKYPTWFSEGVAQLASGPGNWLSSGLHLDKDSVDSVIKSQLSTLSDNTNASIYGTGYLACGYLGYLANGGTGAVTADNIAKGINNIWHSLISGNSLDSTINTYTNGKYTSISDFTSNLKNDTEACNFVRELITATGSGLGSILTGSLSAADLLYDTEIETKLFEVDSSTSGVLNNYGGLDITVLSGGTNSGSGAKPVDDYIANPDDVYTGGITPTPTPTPTGTIIDLNDLTSVDWAALNAEYDDTLQMISLRQGGTYEITGSNSDVTITTSRDDTTLQCNNASLLGINCRDTNVTLKGKLTTDIIAFGNIDNKADLTGSVSCRGTVTNSGSISDDVIAASTGGNGSIVNTGTIGGDSIVRGAGGIRNLGTMQGNAVGKLSTSIFNYGVIKGTANTDTGSIYNYGTTKNTTSSNSGEVYHYVSKYTKNFTAPSTVKVGETLTDTNSLDNSITIYYNGTSKQVAGTWAVTDSAGNVITDPTSVTMEEGGEYHYRLTIDGLPDHMAFTADTQGNLVQSSLEEAEGGFLASAVSYATTSDGADISGSGRAIVFDYRVTSYGVSGPGIGRGSEEPLGGLNFQIGANRGQNMKIYIDDMSSSSLGIDSLDLGSHEKASQAITNCTKANKRISEARSSLGAYQNRLEHTISNTDNAKENLQASESKIRDANLAQEMVQYSIANILSQAAQSMLAQANQSANKITSLLQ